jgi:hypothetical protein
MSTKPCRECRELRPLDRYLPRRTSPDGNGDRCLDCVLLEARRNREERERRRALVPVKAKPRRRQAQRSGALQPVTQSP